MSNLTDRAIKAAKPKAKPYKLSDGLGMYLLVNPAGSKLWRFKYRYGHREDGKGRKEQTLAFGTYPQVSLADARAKRAEARQLLQDGVNPSEDRKQRQKVEQAAELTLRVVAERWYHGKAVKAAKPWAESTAEKCRLYLERDVYPAIGDKPIADITRRELIQLNERIEKRGAVDIAKKVRQWLSDIFDDAVYNEELDDNPALGLRPGYYGQGAESKHNPAVTFAELPQLLADVDATGSHRATRLAIHMLALVAVRPSELRFARWCEIDGDTWTIPASRMKKRRPHTIPLPRQALDILDECKLINGDNEYIFAGARGRPMSENTINKTLRMAGYKGRQTGHGFRHLMSTELNERSYNPDWIEAALAHATKKTVRGTYNHAEYLEQRRDMLQDWADSISPKVVPLKRQA